MSIIQIETPQAGDTEVLVCVSFRNVELFSSFTSIYRGLIYHCMLLLLVFFCSIYSIKMHRRRYPQRKRTYQAQVRVAKIYCCKDHRDEEVRFFCEDCNDLICDECVQSIHKTHDFKSFKNVVKELIETEGKGLDEVCSVDLSEELEPATERMDAALTEEITRFKAQAEKLVNKINEIRDQKEQEIQNMRGENKIALQQISLILDECIIEPSLKLKQLVSEPGRANDREAVRIIMRLKDVKKSPYDKRLEHTVFIPTFVPAEIDEDVIVKLFGGFEIEEGNLREFFSK